VCQGHLRDIIYRGTQQQLQQALMEDGKLALVRLVGESNAPFISREYSIYVKLYMKELFKTIFMNERYKYMSTLRYSGLL